MAKLRGITNSMMSDVKADIHKYEMATTSDTKYTDAYKLMKTHSEIRYCNYWSDESMAKGNGMMDYSITMEDAINGKENEDNEVHINQTNKDKIKMCGTSYEVGSVNKVVYNKKERYIRIYYYNKYRKRGDIDYLCCWGQYDMIGGKMSDRMKAVNDKNFSDAVDYLLSCLA